MTTTVTRPAATSTMSLLALARLEARRFARHPAFLAGVALLGWGLWAGLNHKSTDAYSTGVEPAFLVGVFGMVVAFRLTQSTRRSSEALNSAPTPAPVRTAALCIACLVPAAVGGLSLVAILTVDHVQGSWAYGTFGTGDRFAIFAGQTVVACLGGPLLGVAAGRWLRFPGAAILLVVSVVGWVTVANGLSTNSQNGTPQLLFRLFSPFAFFTTIDTRPDVRVECWRGSPWWYLVWLLVLCALAAVAAMLRGADEPARATLLRIFGALLVVAVVAYVLAVTGGLDQAVYVFPDSTVIPIS